MHAVNVRRKLQMDSASSKIPFSLCAPIAPEIIAKMLKEILFKNRLIIMGRVIIAIETIAIIPQEDFIRDRLELRVLRASLTEEPTSGTKLLIAKRAVFIERESAP